MPSTPTRGRAAGFTLIEVLIVVAIIGILAAIAYPSYGQYVQKTRRSDAHLSLLSARQAMERCRSTSYSYAGCTLPGAASDGSAESEEGHYTLTLSGQTASAFVITATAKGAQTSDEACRKMSIDNLDDTKGLDASNAASDACWS